MNRIDRVSAILIQLQSRKIVKAQDIADRFGISLRTVYRDIKTLESSGIPLRGEAGIGYSIMDGYKLPPVMFSKEEATALLTAEKLVEKFTDRPTSESYASAMLKIRSVLRSSEKEFLEGIDDNIAVFKRVGDPVSNDSAAIQNILKAIAVRNRITLSYESLYREEKTEREVEPLGIFFRGNYWHLIAYCRLRRDYRDFRVDRISRLVMTDNPFTGNHPSLKSYLDKMMKKWELHKVVIRINKGVSHMMRDQKYYNGFVSEMVYDNEVEMTFLTYSMEGFARWYLMFGDQAKILEPAALKNKLQGILESLIAKNTELA